MKKLQIVTIIFILLTLTACTGNISTPLPINNTDDIATIVAATLSAIPSPIPTETLIPTQMLPPTILPPEPLDRTNIQSVINWISYAFSQNKPDMIADLIGDNGTEFGARFASQVAFPGYNNSELIVSELRKGIQTDTPTCEGYSVTLNARPDKAEIYFSGLKFEWNADIAGFIFFYQNDGWELVAIAAIPPDQTWSNLYQTLWACP